MGAVMWIEVLSRHGEVWARERIEAHEARVGRAFDNDVVVDDPHVAPHHLRIFRGEDGELVAEDLGTLNGLYPEHGAKRVPRLSLASEPGIRIGRTVLRVHDAAHAVAPERALTPPRAHAAWAGGVGLVLLALMVLLQWLALTTEPSANRLLLPPLGLAMTLALWTTLWAVLSRIFFGQARYALQLRIAVTACLAFVIWDQLSASASFAFAWREMAELAAVGIWVLFAATCFAHLYTIAPRHLRLVGGLAVAILVVGVTLQYAGRSEARKLVGQSANLGDLRPPGFRMVPLASADEFFRRAEGTKVKVDQARLKEPPAGALLPDYDGSDD